MADRDRGTAKAGEVVVVELIEQPSEHSEAIGRVREVLGHATDPGIEIEIALRKHSLPFEFSEEAKRQAKRRRSRACSSSGASAAASSRTSCPTRRWTGASTCATS